MFILLSVLSNSSKDGFKLGQIKPGERPAPLPRWFVGQDTVIPQIEGKVIRSRSRKGISAITGRGVTLAEFANALQETLGTFVHDKTNLPGKYYFGIEFRSVDAAPDDGVPDLAGAVQDLGLLLAREKGTVEALVIDHIEKLPTAN